ncbi:hypothetical protein PN290_14410 [Romboutsia sp. 1001216sp1]|uniref:hypothetical protein n=1 Tax=unclassified Romboutsia TaxID=2626894 RepID=UPI0018A9EE53|nr:hypothetical protein [Romboutsia sp. 1001216sp1]MDB8794898.1 hypothetical protein [Romboutsia sp. 1001216sp1]MDB8797727.1 hypothetical protein [Romboutsia sp. 1001216sp1]MDB8800548.1 hypothetical protein [Romboutsia sp. 1001216sp1]
MYLIDELDLHKQNEILRGYLDKGAVGFIYETINTYNGKKYLGRKNFLTPEGKNNGWTNYYGSGVFIKRLVKNKEYKKSLVRKIFYIGYSESDLIEKEQYYLDKFDCVNNTNYYNINKNANGGYSRAGYSENQLKNWSKKMSKKNLEYYLNNSDKVKERIRSSNQNRKEVMNSKDWNNYIEKMKASVSGENNYWAMSVKVFKNDILIEKFGCLQDAFKYFEKQRILTSYTTFHKMRKGYVYKGYSLEVEERDNSYTGNSIILYNESEVKEFKYYKEVYNFLKEKGYIKSYTSFTRDRNNNQLIMGYSISKGTSN